MQIGRAYQVILLSIVEGFAALIVLIGIAHGWWEEYQTGYSCLTLGLTVLALTHLLAKGRNRVTWSERISSWHLRALGPPQAGPCMRKARQEMMELIDASPEKECEEAADVIICLASFMCAKIGRAHV